MQVAHHVLESVGASSDGLSSLQSLQPDLMIVFGDKAFFAESDVLKQLPAQFPGTAILGCSTAGEITNDGVLDGSCTFSAVKFDQVQVRAASTLLNSMADSLAAGEAIGQQLADPALRAVLVFGPGVQINGSALVEGISHHIGKHIPITGGLAGDGGAFAQTFTLDNQGVADNKIVAVGLYGEALRFSHGSFGGWEPFGITRKVTRCDGNTLYELDGEPALDVYKRYLGEHAKGLPASGLLFPFAMLGEDHSAIGLIRTILGINEAEGSLTLAGAIDPNGYLQLMHASTDRLVDGAEAAAEAAQEMLDATSDGLAILVSCVGRKLVMGARVDEEVEAVGEVFGQNAQLTGFYSYGEISPFTPGSDCRLHNQTMTVSFITEA